MNATSDLAQLPTSLSSAKEVLDTAGMVPPSLVNTRPSITAASWRVRVPLGLKRVPAVLLPLTKPRL